MRVPRAELAVAVCNAGGLGIMCAFTLASPKELAAEIKKAREHLNPWIVQHFLELRGSTGVVANDLVLVGQEVVGFWPLFPVSP